MPKLYSYMKVTDTDTLEGLPLMTKIRTVLNTWFKESGRSEAQQMKMNEDVSKTELQLQADLLQFIEKALKPIKQGKNKSVTIDISSEFSPVLDVVLDSRRIMAAYNVVIISRPKPLVDIKYNIRIRLEAK